MSSKILTLEVLPTSGIRDRRSVFDNVLQGLVQVYSIKSVKMEPSKIFAT
jgi:hypothetical protein